MLSFFIGIFASESKQCVVVKQIYSVRVHCSAVHVRNLGCVQLID